MAVLKTKNLISFKNMVLTPHIIAGAVVAAKIWNPLLGLPLAFLSHFLLDALPHREYSIAGLTRPKSKNFAESAAKVLVDASLGLGLVVFGAPAQINFPYLAGAITLSVLPDFFQFLNLLNPRWLGKFNHWHCDVVHIKPKPQKIWGWIFQVLFSAGLFLILIWR